MKLWPFINLISCVYACPTTTASTTTTIKPSTTISGSRTYHEFYKFSHMRYTGCRSNENVACQLLELNLTALIHENDFKIDLGYVVKYMAKMTTMSIKGTYLSRFKFYFESLVYEEITFLYSETAIYGVILYMKGFNMIQYIIRQLHPLVTVIEQRGKFNLLDRRNRRNQINFKSWQHFQLPGDYGYKVPDDTLSWLFKYVHDQIPEKQHLLFMKGNNDTTTVANVSVIIKYTREFASHISVHPKYGMYLLSAHVMKMLQMVYSSSGILIDFKLRCIQQAKIDDNINSDDLLRLGKVVFNNYNYNTSGRPIGDNGHASRQSNDIAIVFVTHLGKSKSVSGKAYKYKIHAGKTGTLIKAEAAVGTKVVAHEVGHLLGASHGFDKNYIMQYGKGYQTRSGIHCTIMGAAKSRTPCSPIYFFSNPRTIFMHEALGIEWKFDNAKLLNQNRFVLQESDNENMTCQWGFGYKQEIIDCLLLPTIKFRNCDSTDPDYPIFG